MGIVSCSVTHNTCSLGSLALFKITREEQGSRIMALLEKGFAKEIVAIKTCNRYELFMYIDDNVDDEGLMNNLISIFDSGAKNFHIRHGDDSIRHLFEISTTLDSMIVGEHQILGQLKNAFDLAKKEGTVDLHLTPIFERAIKAGKRARNETKLCMGNLSMASIAIKLAENKLGDLKDKSVLILGAGKISTMIAKMAKAKGPSKTYVTNRTPERALELASDTGAMAIPFENFRSYLYHCDIVFSASSAPHALIHRDEMMRATTIRETPLVIIDLAMPPDVDEDARSLDGLLYCGLEAIRSYTKNIEDERRKEIPKVGRIIEEEMAALDRQLKLLDRKEIIRDISIYMENIRKKELEKLVASKYYGSKDIEAFSKSLVKKTFHNLFINLKEPNNAFYDAALVRDFITLKP